MDAINACGGARGEFGVQWTEFDRADRIVGKEKLFKTRKAMERFAAKLE